MLIKTKREKFDPKTTTVRMVGYEGDKIYRVYSPMMKGVYLCSSIKFNEIPKSSHTPQVTPPQNDVNQAINSSFPEIYCSNDSIVNDSPTSENDDQPTSENTRSNIGRPKGSKNKSYERNLERLGSLRNLPGRNVIAMATVLPTNYEEAINSDDHHKWREAMNTEINQLLKFKTWEMVKRPKNDEVILLKIRRPNR
ncbi:hypothetical protein SSS_01545 [Sarcoptes scabiei]|uniref:Retroviral polymerase SH3-like domain-containing protein n=1 Tax=Sarcoptes scabiei TaxID=52283 RepID=A0A834RFH2_SARSC|nr:hypothetical protein SSS_01545 [Sarcoptes scabiei]